MSLDKKIEQKWYESDLYKWDINSQSQKFAIDTPPPTVSGSLHMGHVFSYTQADFIARFKRMMGHNVFYPIGFDDNGLPTEKLTEKIIGRRGKDMPKAEFITECKKVVFEAEIEFEKLFKALGLSFDWSQKYQTISDESIAVAHDSFNDLIQKGLIYKASNPVYWCTVDRTALAQADLEDKEKDSEEVIFKCKIDGVEHKIMTTRPELIPACVMVLYHPDDARFKVGQMVKMPFLNNEVPLIADEAVKMDKGTGLVMCCSYGDWQDVEWIRKYKLKSKPIIQEDGFIDKAVYGLETEKIKINEARKLAISLLDNPEIKPIKHTVKCAERSGMPIEIMETEQYYIDFGLGGNGKINAEQFKTDLLAIVDKIEFKPAHLKNRLTDWIKGLNQDWCVSRDRFSGVPIPNSNQVFDTWFTSSLTPKLATNNKELFPFDLRPQAHEIIRTWAFYTIVKSYFHGANNTPLEGGSNAEHSGRGYNVANIEFAKEMRKEMTKEEFKLWNKINNNQLGFKFRRQHPIGNFITDFCCLEKNLIIELDGSQHTEQEKYDNQRTNFLNKNGFKVIRFWNNEFMKNFDDCIEFIVYCLNEKTPPQISFGNLTLPQGEDYASCHTLNSTLEGESDLQSKSGGGSILPINIEKDYPAIFKHLQKYQTQCQKRTDQGSDWTNLRSCAYIDDFVKERIVWQEIVQKPCFCYTNDKIYGEASSFVMIGEGLKYLTAILNSKFCTWAFKKFYAGGGLGKNGFRYKKVFLEQIPIPKIDAEAQKPFEEKVDKMIEIKQKIQAINTKILKLIAGDFETADITKLHNWYELSWTDFVKKCKIKGSIKDEWLERFEQNKKDIKILQTKAIKIDNDIDKMVYGLYKLSDIEITMIDEVSKKIETE